MKYYVTLVHGTATPLQRFTCWRTRRWAWLEEDSLLIESIKNAFPESIVDNDFRWSGQNSITARYRASLSLRRYIRVRIKEHPGFQHIVIGHSHGGTVAIIAASSGLVASRLIAIVCLSTPFLHAQGRFSFARWAFQLPGLLLMVGLVTLGLNLPISSSILIPSFCVFMLALELFIFFKLSKLYLAKIARLSKRMRLPDVLHTNVVLVRSEGDEASAALVSTHFATWLVQRMWRAERVIWGTVDNSQRTQLFSTAPPDLVMARSLGLIDGAGFHRLFRQRWLRTPRTLWTIPVVLLYISIILSFWGPASRFNLQIRGRPFPVGEFIVMFWPLVLAFVFFLIALCVASLVLAMTVGPEMLWAAAVLDVFAEVTPPGLWPVYQFAHLPNPEAEFDLSHGRGYSDPVIIAWMCEWFRSLEQRHSNGCCGEDR